jgi:hypothetical protein
MIVYNITNKVTHEIVNEWIDWQKQEHIPDIMRSGMFTEYKFFRLLDQEEEEGITFVIQYFAPSIENYQRYIEDHAPALREKALSKWGHKFIAFRTVMEVVN